MRGFRKDQAACQRALSEALVRTGRGAPWAVNAHQPSRLDASTTLAARSPPGEPLRRARRHPRPGDRQEGRGRCWSAALTGSLHGPGLGQVCRIERQLTPTGEPRRAIAYAVTSATPHQASPGRLVRWWRGQWDIENRHPGVRDVTCAEDRSQVRTGTGPQVLAAPRNTARCVPRRAGHTTIADAARSSAAHPPAALARLGLLPAIRR